MKIDEAIKELEVAERRAHKITAWKREDAIKLGIVALKRCKKEREIQGGLYNYVLPGETE